MTTLLNHSSRGVAVTLSLLPLLLGMTTVPAIAQPTAPIEISQGLNGWNTVFRVAQLLDDDLDPSSLVLQLELLNKPATRYANAVYQIYGRYDGEWKAIYTSVGARLVTSTVGATILEPEVIRLIDLEDALQREFDENDIDLTDVELKYVVQMRYDLLSGGRDLRWATELVQSYNSLTSVRSTNLVVINSTTTTVIDTATTVIDVDGTVIDVDYEYDEDDDDNDDDIDYEYDDDDDNDDDRPRRRNCNQGIGNGSEGCDPGNSRPHGGSNDEGGRTPGGGRQGGNGGGRGR